MSESKKKTDAAEDITEETSETVQCGSSEETSAEAPCGCTAEDSSEECDKSSKGKRGCGKGKKEIADRDKKIAELEEKLSSEHDTHLRMMAEYDNFRRRVTKEKDGIYTDAVFDTLAKLLPLIDNLDRALEAETDKESSMYKGVQMVKKQCDEIFQSFGVEEIPALGETFDPNLHAAVMHDEDPEKGESEITAVFQKGYRKGDRILRYSAVKVSN